MALYDKYRLLGPYKRPDGRQHCYLIDIYGKKKTVSWPKYLVEMSIGRHLAKNEIVHHIDGNVSNNNLDNLEILDRAVHGALHNRSSDEIFRCPSCNKIFVLSGPKVTKLKIEQRRNRALSGPFCSRHCAGKYNAKV